MTPGGVRAGENDKIGLFEVLVAAGHNVCAEGPFVCGHGRRHAEPGIGIDIRRTDEAFHQLIGDVIVLGQKLTGNIERDSVRSVLSDRVAEFSRDEIEGFVPTRAPAGDFRIQQSRFHSQGFA